MASEIQEKPGGNGPGSGDEHETVAVLAPGHTFSSVTDKISSLVLDRPFYWRWFAGLLSSFALVSMLLVAIAFLLWPGVGLSISFLSSYGQSELAKQS